MARASVGEVPQEACPEGAHKRDCPPETNMDTNRRTTVTNSAGELNARLKTHACFTIIYYFSTVPR